MKIKSVIASEILDSRGNPTIRVNVTLENGISGVASVPSGASTGKREALELRDGDKNRYQGKGVLKAVSYVNNVIANAIIGLNVLDINKIDDLMIKLDNTENKSNLGANAILGVSLAVLKAGANYLDIPLYKHIGGLRAHVLPIPLVNVINGGAHAFGKLDIQEFMIVPMKADSFHEAVRMAAETFHTLKSILERDNLSTAVGDEGGFSPEINSNKEALDYLTKAIKEAGYEGRMFIALDVAASEFISEDNTYKLKDGRILTSDDLINTYKKWIKEYPIVSIEDGLGEEDFEGWKKLSLELNPYIQNVGDDLFVTNKKIFMEGVKNGIGNSILIKLNQIGTFTETMDTIEYARNHGYSYIISHRSGETVDTTISDLAVGTNALEIKTGSMSRAERIEKYNRLMEIEYELGSSAVYAGKLINN